ncbi:MAG: tRNA lysidine(34) synthetase TilS [Hyphomicrobiaceae bacterium]|nr:tRNA lysidine(34) synthetase TilS [Hyphomicrobiaceae bacterium]
MPHESPAAAVFSEAEVSSLFAAVGTDARGLALAVSGGADSTALLLLFARYRGLNAAFAAAPCLVVTVDHGLRCASPREAEAVAARAAALGLEHVTLCWLGPKPAAGIAAAAREARYALIADLMRTRGLGTLITAHTLEDQAETLLMRLARGSGVDGLSGMAPVSTFGAPPLRLVRPLLGVSKARLTGFLAACGETWSEDPTNADLAFERPRLRARAPALAEIGLTPAALALAARRQARARAALDAAAAAFLASPGARIDPLGFVVLDRDAFARLEEEIALRVLRMAIVCAGGGAPVSLSRLEDLHARLAAGDGTRFTLGRALVARDARGLVVSREPGRTPLSRLPLACGLDRLWDNRFRVRAGAVGDGLALGPLGGAGLAEAGRAGLIRPRGAPAMALRTLPAVWRDGALLAVPSLGFDPAQLQLAIQVEFKGLGGLRSTFLG